MIKYYIFALFIAVAMVFVSVPFADAKKDTESNAVTHMWLRAGTTMVFAPVGSLQQCEMYVKQAASLNSSEANCYMGQQLVKTINCTKPLKRGETPSCD